MQPSWPKTSLSIHAGCSGAGFYHVDFLKGNLHSGIQLHVSVQAD